jgi:4-diphosphocytidyl-2-C-methyl-D-erythritol kinase
VSVVRDLFPHALAIVPVAAALATPDVYREADRQGLARPAAQLADRREQVLAWLAAGGSPPPELLVNDLEPAARALCPLIDRALDDLRSAGAEHVLVSGSGPTVFGVFAGADGERAAEAAVAALRGHHPHASAALPVGPDYAHPRPLAATR